MSDCDGNKGSRAAITEKRQGNRGGGCVGIMFQLFDWHRRFAKKQLFKRKLLPPAAVAKQAVKKFKGDEKMPTAKLHLIADENKGGFPSMRKKGGRSVDPEQKHGTQAPGLIARLMGLESMPLVHQKVKKNLPSESYNHKREDSVNGSSCLRKKDLDEKRDMKQVLRPPKIQKTGEPDGGVVSRFRGEALQIKNVLARSRKHHHHKLVTPVKSPRITASNNMSRTSSKLIDAATKILEPGLQNKRRAKYALPYISSTQLASVELEMAERSLFASAGMQRHAVARETLANKHFMGEPPCKNCGNLLDIMDCRPIMKEEISNHASICPHHFDDSCLDRQRPARSAVVPQKTIFHKGRQQESLAADSLSGRPGGGQIKYVKPFMESRDGFPFDSRKRNSHRDEMAVEERIMPGSRNGYLKGRSASRRLSVTSTYNKDFVALNRSASIRTHPRSTARADSSEMDVANHPRRSKFSSEVKPPLPKMRTSIEHPPTAICLLAKQKSSNELLGKGNTARCSENINGVVSFTFKSALNYKAGYSNEGKNNRQGPNGFNKKTSLESKPVLVGDLYGGLQQKHCALSGDALGAFLEQKLKELTSQEEEGATISCRMSERPTAAILQELITAVTEEAYLPEYSVAADSKNTFQVKPSIHNAAKVLPDVNSLSPGSVLQASFSNDSCASGICDDISGSKLRPTVHDTELLDSATSLKMGGTHFIKLTSLINRVATMMDSLILADCRLAGSKVNLAKDKFLHAELLIASLSPENPKCLEDVMFTLLQMERPEVKALFSLGDAEVGSDMKAFILDCLLECLDKGYNRYCNAGYKGWAKQLSSWGPEILTLDIVSEVLRWTGLSGLTLDETIEHDMSHSTGKWTDFDTVAFELGAAFANDMLTDAVEEIAASILSPAL